MVLGVVSATAAGCAHMPPAASWPDLMARLDPGTGVALTSTDGTEVSGRVAAISLDAMRLTVDGTSRQVAATDVRELTRDGDPLWNGLAIGAGIGIAGTLLPDPRYYDCGQSTPCEDPQLGQRLTFLAGATLLGLVIDAVHRDRTVLYRSPAGLTLRVSPLVSPVRQGLFVSIGTASVRH